MTIFRALLLESQIYTTSQMIEETKAKLFSFTHIELLIDDAMGMPRTGPLVKRLIYLIEMRILCKWELDLDYSEDFATYNFLITELETKRS